MVLWNITIFSIFISPFLGYNFMYHNIIPNDTEKYKWGNSIEFFEILLYYLLIFRLFKNYKVYHIMIHRYHIMIPKSINEESPYGSLKYYYIIYYFLDFSRIIKAYHNIIPNDTEKYKWGNSIEFFEILLYNLLFFRLFRNYKVYHIMIPKSINEESLYGSLKYYYIIY
jgi:hypothetical protein